MSKAKNTTGKVPETKVEAPTIIKLTKTQRELFVTKRNQANEGVQIIVGEYNKLSAEILGKLVGNFIEELGINIVDETWSFDANSMTFTREKKK